MKIKDIWLWGDVIDFVFIESGIYKAVVNKKNCIHIYEHSEETFNTHRYSDYIIILYET